MHWSPLGYLHCSQRFKISAAPKLPLSNPENMRWCPIDCTMSNNAQCKEHVLSSIKEPEPAAAKDE